MVALRFFIFGYGAGVLAGLGTGIVYGSFAGWLMAWLGGSGFSLLLAYLWHRSDQVARLTGSEDPDFGTWDSDFSTELLAADQQADQKARPQSRVRDRRRA